jgi:uncharacterized membrane protein
MSKVRDVHRRNWMLQCARRDGRIVDTQIMASLQNGTAFFATTSMLALGGSFSLLSQTDRIVNLFRDLPITAGASTGATELKLLILCAIYGYAFFQFGWAYRLFNYASILLGGIPPFHRDVSPEERRAIEFAAARPALMQIVAGRHFNWGLRALFYSIGYLGFFVNAWVFVATTTCIAVVLYRRQYASSALGATKLGLDSLMVPPPAPPAAHGDLEEEETGPEGR